LPRSRVAPPGLAWCAPPLRSRRDSPPLRAVLGAAVLPLLPCRCAGWLHARVLLQGNLHPLARCAPTLPTCRTGHVMLTSRVRVRLASLALCAPQGRGDTRQKEGGDGSLPSLSCAVWCSSVPLPAFPLCCVCWHDMCWLVGCDGVAGVLACSWSLSYVFSLPVSGGCPWPWVALHLARGWMIPFPRCPTCCRGS